MKRLVVLLVALALTAGCGSTVQVRGQATVGGDQLGADLGSPAGPGATTAPTGDGTLIGAGPTAGVAIPGATTAPTGGAVAGPVATGTGGPAAATHQPIQIGFITTSVGNASSLGVNAGQSYSDQSMWTALVTDYNLHGGLAGHAIKPVYGATDTASTNWESNFSQVCSTFTQDNKVKAVIGYIFVFIKSFESCLAKARVPHLYGGYQPGDVTDQRQYPTLISSTHPSVDAHNLTPLVGALASGRLTKKTKLGILQDDCGDGARAYSRTLEPWLKKNGINYQTVMMGCAQGSGDASSAAASISSAELRFASAGVDMVYAKDVALLVFMTNAQSQGYQPEYITSLAGAALEVNAPAKQMEHLHGYGWMPAVDVNAQHQPYPQTAQQKTCLGRLTKHGLRPAQYNDFMAAYVACDGLELYARALERTGGVTEPASIVSAVTASLPGFSAAAVYGGTMVARQNQRGGATTYREWGWTGSCRCTTYRGPTRPIPAV